MGHDLYASARRSNPHRNRAPADRRPEPKELPSLKITDLLGLPALHTEQIGSANHIYFKKSSAQQEVRCLCCKVLGQFGQALRGNDSRKTPFAAVAHQVGHGGEADTSCWRC